MKKWGTWPEDEQVPVRDGVGLVNYKPVEFHMTGRGRCETFRRSLDT